MTETKIDRTHHQSKNFLAKVDTVNDIKRKIEEAHSMVVVSFSGITVEEITALRSKFRESGVEYVVLKNTLVRRALDDLDIPQFDELLKGPSAFAFGMTDAVAPAKVIAEYIDKQKSAKMAIKAGLVEGQYYDAESIVALSKLPPREVLIAKIMGSLNAPVTNFVGVLSATLRSLVYALDGVRQQKEAQ